MVISFYKPIQNAYISINIIDIFSCRVSLTELKKILNLFGLEKKGVKSEVCTRLLDYLLEPRDIGKKLPQPKKKKVWSCIYVLHSIASWLRMA